VGATSLLGYTSPVTLSVSGNPTSTTTVFGTNPVTPTGSSTLTIGNTGAAAAGSFTVQVSASSSAGPKSKTVTLNISTAAPGVPTLSAPANEATGQAVSPTFSWSAVDQAQSYDLDIATDAFFGNIVHSATGLTGTSYSGATLSAGTVYFWRVRAVNACQNGSYSAVYHITTLPQPGACTGTQATLYSTGFETGADGWTHSGTGDLWAISTANPKEGAQAWRAPDPASVSDQRLVSPAVVLPSGTDLLSLSFWHVPVMESNGSICFDGGVLEITSDGGSVWTPVPDAQWMAGAYNGTISSTYDNPLAGLNSWCGTSTVYRNSIANLNSYAGQTVQFRFRAGSDTSVSKTGWDVDAVTVQSCKIIVRDVLNFLPAVNK
jgi:hypothetical protein